MDIWAAALCGKIRSQFRAHHRGNKRCIHPSIHDDVAAHLIEWPSNPRAVMKMLMRTVKKTKTVATLFIVFNLRCFLLSFRSYFTMETTTKAKPVKHRDWWEKWFWEDNSSKENWTGSRGRVEFTGDRRCCYTMAETIPVKTLVVAIVIGFHCESQDPCCCTA